MKDKIVVNDSDPTVIIIKGKKYKLKRMKGKILDHHFHPDHVVFEPFDEKKFQKSMDYIVKKIGDAVDVREILEETFKSMTLEEVRKIEKLLREGKPVKKTKGCVGLTIGDDSSGSFVQIA